MPFALDKVFVIPLATGQVNQAQLSDMHGCHRPRRLVAAFHYHLPPLGGIIMAGRGAHGLHALHASSMDRGRGGDSSTRYLYRMPHIVKQFYQTRVRLTCRRHTQ